VKQSCAFQPHRADTHGEPQKVTLVKISERLVVLILCGLLLSALAPSLPAQTITTGSIEGVVTDIKGAVASGVTVVVTSPNLIMSRSAKTDDKGIYRILNLPPGKYAVTVEASQGFAKFQQKNVEVNLGKTSAVAIRLEIATIGAEIEVAVTAGAPVDITANTTGTNIASEQFSNFPTQRTVQSLYRIAPTVTRSGLRDASGRDRDPSVAGSSGPENGYILDGVNTTDPGFGGAGANLPFEFVQEVEIKTGAYGAEYGLSTGGIFNVITKSGGNELHGDAFAYFTIQDLVRQTKNFSFTGSAPNGFSEIDAGFDLGGSIKRDKLWFFGAFNPQRRENLFLTQTFRQEVENKITTPFYAGKLTWAISRNNLFTFSTFSDFTKEDGFLFGSSGFGADLNSFSGRNETGGHNYALRLNSSITPQWIGEFSVGLHFQRSNKIPDASVVDTPQMGDNFAILRADGTIAPVIQSNLLFNPEAGQAANVTGFLDFVLAPGGTLQRGFTRQGFGTFGTFGSFGSDKRNRIEVAARLQNLWGRHTFKYGFEAYRNIYDLNVRVSGPPRTFGNPLGLSLQSTDNNVVDGFNARNTFSVCTTRVISSVNTIVCPVSAAAQRVSQLVAAGAVPGFTAVQNGPITAAEGSNNPFLIRLSTRVLDVKTLAQSHTDVESFYLQDGYQLASGLQLNVGFRWDLQQAYGQGDKLYLKLNSLRDNLEPRVGLIWDFTGKGKGKLFINYARFIEVPIPLRINVLAGSENSGSFKDLFVNRYAAPAGATIVPGVASSLLVGALNTPAHVTPIDSDLKPQTVNEATVGIEYEIVKDLTLGFRGLYRAQGSVIEDGSPDDGRSFFIFNPGESASERQACASASGCFGRARRYYRALEFTATKRFSKKYQFIASYVYSSLLGNYEGLYRNDNGQAVPNLTSLFDLVSLLANVYGRLPNDRPHQFKISGSYQTPWGLMISGNFNGQSGTPLNQLIPHFAYGNNEGFAVPRGTAVAPIDAPGGISAGRTRTPTWWNMDIGAAYPIQLKGDLKLNFQINWFNVLNSQRTIRQDETFLINSSISGVPPIPNPFYGTGTIFQSPSSLMLGVKLQF
jgi:outer membrane receptor protein involved in Fe transport